MAQGYLTVEISNTRIRFLFVERQGQEFKVLKSGVMAHALSLTTPGHLSQALKALLAKEHLDPQRLFVSICRPTNFIRQMYMPRMTAREMDEVITAEIEKLPLFTNTKFDYIFHSTPSSQDKQNVVFAGIEQTVLDYVLAECRALDIPFEHLEISPLNIKELIGLIEPGLDNQALLIINDQFSYLMVVRHRECRFMYQVAMGLEHLYPHGNDQVNKNSLLSLLGELQRVLKSYLSLNKTEKLQKLWLVWDNQTAGDLSQWMVGQLGVDVDVISLNKVPQFQTNQDPTVTNPAMILGAVPLVVYLKKIKEQFALDHFFRAVNFRKYVLRCVTVASLVVVVAGAVLGFKSFDYYYQRSKLSREIAVLSQQEEALRSSTQELYKRRDEYLRVRQGLLDQAKYVKTLNRISWSQVLSVVAEEMPEQLSLTSFKFDEAGSVSFFGDALGVEVIAELIRRVDVSAILQDGKFDFLTEKVVDKQKIFSFGILAQLQANDPTKVDANQDTQGLRPTNTGEAAQAADLKTTQLAKEETHE